MIIQRLKYNCNMNLTKIELEKIVKESVKNVLNETSRRQKAQ